MENIEQPYNWKTNWQGKQKLRQLNYAASMVKLCLDKFVVVVGVRQVKLLIISPGTILHAKDVNVEAFAEI